MTDPDKVKMMFKLMEYDYLSDGQENLIIKFEERFNRRGYLTEGEFDVLKNIFEDAASKVEWSRW